LAVAEAPRTDEDRQIVILGAGGTGLDALDILDAINARGGRYRCLGFLDDDERRWGEELAGFRILGPLALAPEVADARFVHAIGSPRNFQNRPAITERSGIVPDRLETLVHPSAVISPRCRLGRGVIVYPNVFLGPRSRVGDGVTILANAAINHDSELGDWTLIASGVNVAGAVRVGSCCYLGTGAAVKEGVNIGTGVMVGMGAVVIRDVPAHTVVVGNPAREIRGPTDEP
jgi:sugar O-acyltransferase (sialic acid O-acetyltransferase NeuD family)